MEVGQMDDELAGVSAPHVLGPGQSPCHHQGRVCACASLPMLLLTKPCYLVLLFFMGFCFSSPPTGDTSPVNAHVQEQSYLESLGRARALRSLYQERARDGVC